MKEVRILYSSADIHAEIKRLFSQPKSSDRRVALVAYVGGNGESFLPNPSGLHIICSPSPGGTDPDTLRSLIKRKAKVEFSDGLHMKVYWSRNRGCILTSANLSSSALGSSSLKEAGLWLPPGMVNINKLIKYAHPRPVKQSDLHKLDKLSRERKKTVRNGEVRTNKAIDFLKWYTAPHRSQWKLAWCDESLVGTATIAKEQAQSDYGKREPHYWMCVGKGRSRRNDWLLSFTITETGIKYLQWMFVDFIVKVAPKEKRYYFRDWPYHAVQVNAPSQYPAPPFKITPQFRRAFKHAIKTYRADRIMEAKSDNPPARLLKYVAEEMKGS